MGGKEDCGALCDFDNIASDARDALEGLEMYT